MSEVGALFNLTATAGKNRVFRTGRLALVSLSIGSQPQASEQLRQRGVGGLGTALEDLGSGGVVARQDLKRAAGIRQRGLLRHLQALMLEVSELLKFGHFDSSGWFCIFEPSALASQ